MSTQVVNPAVFESGGVKERVRTQYVSGDAFDRLGVRAHIGRLIAPADDAVSAAPVSVISHAFWRARFGATRPSSGAGSPTTDARCKSSG
jgi:hypothetical protein